MPQNLNPVQRNFVNEAARPMIEEIIRMHARLQNFVADYDNQQVPITADSEVLNDGDGTSPRADAPTLTGLNLQQLRSFANNMAGQINGSTLNVLISLAVRDVDTIRRGV
jgi:hypothetical protein